MVCCKTAAAVAVVAMLSMATTVAFLPATTGPRLGGPSPYRIFSHQHERTASNLRESRKPLALRMGESMLQDIIAKKQAKVDELKANPPAGVAELLEKMGTIKPKQTIFK